MSKKISRRDFVQGGTALGLAGTLGGCCKAPNYGPPELNPGGIYWTGSACFLGATGMAVFDPGEVPPDSWVYFVIVGQNYGPEADPLAILDEDTGRYYLRAPIEYDEEAGSATFFCPREP